jgi:DNA-binding NtrC family response regulator
MLVALDSTMHSYEYPSHDRRTARAKSDAVWIGTSPASAALMNAAIRAARLDSNLLVTGERGTGRRLLARIIHANSPRHTAPFVELELTANAVSDAIATIDCYEHAGRGAVYVDRIESRSADVQKRLAHAFALKSPVRPRLIASATHDLRAELNEGRLDERLFYLFGAQLEVPPLRHRAADIPLLVDHFLVQFANDAHGIGRGRSFSADAMALLERHDWPGNVRELRGAVERALTTSTARVIEPEDLPSEIALRLQPMPEEEAMTLDAVERQHIQRVLRLTGGRLTRAAEMLGIHRNTLRRKLDQYEIRGHAEE